MLREITIIVFCLCACACTVVSPEEQRYNYVVGLCATTGKCGPLDTESEPLISIQNNIGQMCETEDNSKKD